MLKTFVHPYTKKALKKDSYNNLFCENSNQHDIFQCYDGCYDFSISNPEVGESRAAYDDHYAHRQFPELTLKAITEPWFDDTIPWRRRMLDCLDKLSDRTVLLLGNGGSFKEFYFLHLGAHVVYTDLSIEAVKQAKLAFQASELYAQYDKQIEFHAVDALHLPFADESIDIIYGTKFVGFLDSLPEFFSEVSRCLKPGGKCRFGDDANSPMYDNLRRIWYPIRSRFLQKSWSSLKRIRSGTTYSPYGIMEKSLKPFIDQFGFSKLLFIRESFFLRIAQLFWGTIVRWDHKRLRYARPFYLILKWIDNQLTNTKWMQRNALSLTWGFDK